MAEKETVMVLKLKVDLQCPCCFKKVKKLLCRFPEIRNQVYNEKANTVTITVVCCCPEKIRDKLCCKGYKLIKSIEIIEPAKPKEKPPPPAPKPEPPKEAPKPPPPKPEPPKEAPKPQPPKPEPPKEAPKPQPPKPEPPKEAPKPQPPKGPLPTPAPPPPEPVVGPCPVPAFPVRTCCGSCYEGYGGGPCYHGYGTPPPPQPCFDGYYGYGHGSGYDSCHVKRCDCYLIEENRQVCYIM